MIGLDTNVVIRYLVQDDAKQARAATRLIEETLSADNPGFISQVVLCEAVWVLEDCYSQTREQIAAILQTLLTTRQVVIQEAGLAWKALREFKAQHVDFSDAVIALIAGGAGCQRIVTFDKTAAKLPAFELLG